MQADRIIRAVALTGALLISLLPVGASAASLNSAVHLDGEYQLAPPLTPDEHAAIIARVQSALTFQRGKTSWKCVQLPLDTSAAAPGEEVLTPVTRYVDIGVALSPITGGDAEGGIAVDVTISLNHKTLSTGHVDVAPTRLVDDRGRGLADAVGQVLGPALDQSAPCTPKVKVKMRTRGNAFGATASFAEDGDGQIALDENGDFSGTIPATFAWTPGQAGSVTCTVSPDSGTNSVELDGSFDDTDGTLHFGLGNLAPPIDSVTCQALGRTVSAAGSGSNSGPVAANEVIVPFDDGAEGSMPIANEVASGDLTIDVQYDTDSAPVALAPPVR